PTPLQGRTRRRRRRHKQRRATMTAGSPRRFDTPTIRATPGVAELHALGASALPAFARAYSPADLDERRVLVLSVEAIDRPRACRSAPLLAQALADQDIEVVQFAASAAGSLRCGALVGQLRALLTGENSPRKYAAIRAFARMGDPAAVPWIEELLRQPDQVT